MKRILVLCVFFMLIGCDKNYHDGLLENLFGINGLKYKIICSNEEFSSGGEGFYYCVYELDKISLDKIINSKLVDFPVKPEYRANWEVVKWEKKPVKLNDLPLYKYCCEYHRPIDFEKCFSEIFEKKIIEKVGNYYSSFYYDNKEEPVYVDFFILVPSENRLYFVSKKT